MFFESSLFLLLALLTFLVTWTRNVFMSLMYGVMLFVNSSLVLFTLGFEFLALVNLLVYVGALAVLFLFVIMLLNIPTVELRAFYRGKGLVAQLALVYLIGRMFVSPVFNNTSTGYFKPTQESINAIGEAFYIRFADVLILNSLVLTTALLGALVLVSLSVGVQLSVVTSVGAQNPTDVIELSRAGPLDNSKPQLTVVTTKSCNTVSNSK